MVVHVFVVRQSIATLFEHRLIDPLLCCFCVSAYQSIQRNSSVAVICDIGH